MSGNLVGLGRVGRLDPVAVRITGEKNTTLLSKMIRTMPGDADRIANKWADRMAAVASNLAPSSAKSKAMGKDTNNPHGTALRDSLIVTRQGPARYSVTSTAPWAIFVIGGARKHVIWASGHGAAGNSRRALSRSRVLNRRADLLTSGQTRKGKQTGPGLFPRYYDRVRHRPDGSTYRVREERKLSTRELTARARKQERRDRLEAEALRLETFGHSEGLRSERPPLLMFPWSKGVSRWKGKLQVGSFVGPVVGLRVKHPGTKRNDFITRARGRIGSPFAADIRKMLEGRY